MNKTIEIRLYEDNSGGLVICSESSAYAVSAVPGVDGLFETDAAVLAERARTHREIAAAPFPHEAANRYVPELEGSAYQEIIPQDFSEHTLVAIWDPSVHPALQRVSDGGCAARCYLGFIG